MKKLGIFLMTISILLAVAFGVCSCGKKEEAACSHRDANDDYLCDACAVDFEDEREHFTHTMESGACTVCGMPESTEGLEMELTYDGKSYTLVGIGNCKAESVTIGVYNGLDVSTIANYAFDACTKITSLQICNSVEKIGYRAFQNCTRLETLTLSRGLKDIASEAFLGCTWLASVSIPDGVTVIGSNAFAECRSLMSVHIGKGVTVVEDGAFTKCSNLSTVVIKEGVAELGKTVFAYCDALETINIPASLVKLSDGCFGYCKSLKTVSTGSLKELPYRCFYGCESLEIINIGSALEKIDYSFDECSSIQAFNVDTENKHFLSVDGSLYNKEQTMLIKYATGSKKTKFVIPASVTRIYGNAFHCSNELSMLIIPESVTVIENNAFKDCKNLIIYCRASKKPKEWPSEWKSNCHVVWGYQGN